jgi:O-antigen ligase
MNVVALKRRLLEKTQIGVWIIFSMAYFWIPDRWNTLLLAGAGGILGYFLLKKGVHPVPGHRFLLSVLIYTGLLVISGAMHWGALAKLPPETSITVTQFDAAWGLEKLSFVVSRYLSLPFLLGMLMLLFQDRTRFYDALPVLPVLFIPSLLVGVYQGLFDIDFLNVPYFASRSQASGLGPHGNAFGISLFLLFPLCIIGIIRKNHPAVKVGMLILSGGILGGILLSGSRTAWLGITIFLLIFPWITAWSGQHISKRLRFLLCACPIMLGLLAGGLVIFGGSQDSFILAKRLNTSWVQIQQGGVRELLQRSGRIHYWTQAIRLIQESPVVGWGPGGYYRHLDNIRFQYGERQRQLDNALNLYLQISAELGLVGLGCHLPFHLIPLWMIVCARKRLHDRAERWTLGIVCATVCIMLFIFLFGVHLLSVNITWIYASLLACLWVTGLHYSVQERVHPINIVWAGGLLILFLVETYTMTFGSHGYRTLQQAPWWPLQYERNCYAPEQWGANTFRWCSQDAFLRIPITKEIPEKITISIAVYHPDVATNPVIVTYGGKYGPTHQLLVNDSTLKTFEIEVSQDDLYFYEEPRTRTGQLFEVVSFDVSRTWVPKEWKINEDPRELGVAIMIPKL